ncbi:MAG: HEAT repeat domain-containing protein [Acetobacteraceae bacterium]
MPEKQPDLFAAGGVKADPPPSGARRSPLDPAAFDDAGLIAAIPRASVTDCRALAAEAVRRRLVSAVSSLEALCRRFKGFGLDHPVSEQTAAIDALAMLGGLGAADALARIIADEVVQGPSLRGAVSAATRLRAQLPANVVIALLRHTEPAIRADACRCADRRPLAIPVLIDLLGDHHRAVATEVACALGRMGRAEARRSLTRLLREAPSADVIAAVAPIADGTCIVLLGRLARSTSKPAAEVREGLEGDRRPSCGDATCSQRGAGRR